MYLGGPRTDALDPSTCALVYLPSGDREVRCWGANRHGQLGYGHTQQMGHQTGFTVAAQPKVDVGSTPTTISSSVAGYGTTCIIDDAKKVKCWGYNAYGQLGVGHKNPIGDNPGEMGANLEAVDLGVDALAIAVGGSHVCALLEGGSVRCWGYNIYGQLCYS